MQTQTQTTDFRQWFSDHEGSLLATARDIFAHPEISGEETWSSHRLAQLLEEAGFRITWGIGGFDTAFLAEWGQGKPIIGFLAEYDALPGLGQAPVCHMEPLGTPGHGCGHNLLGTACAGAAMALKSFLETSVELSAHAGSEYVAGKTSKSTDPSIQNGAPDSVSEPSEICNSFKDCTIRVYGCPAEEIVIGKIQMNKSGVFDDLDVAITWHPFDRNRVSYDIWQAQDVKNYKFYGKAAHASKYPELGRSALDAAELMNVGVNYLREHVADDVRMHYTYTNTDGPANIVPPYASTNYFIRSTKRARTEDASSRVDDCARGAALMTGTRVEIELVTSNWEMKTNRPLALAFHKAMERVPLPVYTQEELDFAAQITKEANLPNPTDTYFGGLEPLEDEPVPFSIGTDVSDVSHTIPTIMLSAATMCKGTALHHWATTAQSGMSIGEKGMLYVAQCMAEGALDLLKDPQILKDAWETFREMGD